MIDLYAVSRVYGKHDNKFVALQDVSLHIASKNRVAIVGKSGSGKSTLMHIMSGLDRPSSGKVVIDGEDIAVMSQKAVDQFRSQSMSFIFQSFFVEAGQTCYQNVSLPLEIANVPLRRRRALIMEALAAVELTDKQLSRAADLSGGQKQRLAIARAIITKPSLLFADEPTGNLDSDTGEKIIQLLFDLNRRLGCTLVIVTHDQELAVRCDQQISLKDGVVQPGSRPRKRRVTM